MRKKIGFLVPIVILTFVFLFAKVKKDLLNTICLKPKETDSEDSQLLSNVINSMFLTQKVYAEEKGQEFNKPNIIIIVSDDLGYADLSLTGCKDVSTPNIDSLAQNGVRFTNGYASCPICSPSRAGLLTGRYQQRFGHEFNFPPVKTKKENYGLPLTETTVADILKKGGYKTGAIGKWHLGEQPEFFPQKRGFDEQFGFLGANYNYINPEPDKPLMVYNNGVLVEEKEYLTDAFSREAVAFIERHKSEPFFLYLAYNAVHTPMQATKEYLDRFSNINIPKRKTYAAMLTAMDEGIGNILKKLEEVKVLEDTIIFFFNDNGGPIEPNASSNLPFRGAKQTVYEGGIRVPLIVQWLKTFPKGKIYEHPVISLDILPTVAAAAKIKLPENKAIDGINLIPFILDENKSLPHNVLFWRFGNLHAIRKNNMKLVVVDDKVELFDLAKDISEKNNLVSSNPKLVKELYQELQEWEANLSKPLWKLDRYHKLSNIEEIIR